MYVRVRQDNLHGEGEACVLKIAIVLAPTPPYICTYASSLSVGWWRRKRWWSLLVLRMVQPSNPTVMLQKLLEYLTFKFTDPHPLSRCHQLFARSTPVDFKVNITSSNISIFTGCRPLPQAWQIWGCLC